MEDKNNNIEELENTKPEESQEIEDLNAQAQNKGNVDYVKKISKYLDDVPDHSKDYGWKEMEDGQLMSYLCYLSFLVFIPILKKDQNNYVQFNIKQGLNLFLLELIAALIFGFLGAIFIYTISWLVTALATLVSIVFFAFSIIGIFNVYNLDAKELPFIGKYKIIK